MSRPPAKMEIVYKYKITPAYVDVKKAPKVVRVQCIQKGKILFVPVRGKSWIRVDEMFDTPTEALLECINGIHRDMSGEAPWKNAQEEYIQICRQLIRAL